MKILDRPRTGAGAPKKRSRYAYLYSVEDIIYFPPTDNTEIVLIGDILLKSGASATKIYITNTSQEYSFEATGEKDNRGFKVKFTGTHPGSEIEALEFAKKNLDRDYIVILPENYEETRSKVLGTMFAPLTFKSSHKSNKDGNKFDLNFEQEVSSDDVYLHYEGALAVEGNLETWNSLTENLPEPGIYYVEQGSDFMFTDGSISDYAVAGNQITLIGQDNPMTGYLTMITGTKILLRKNIPWKSIRGSKIVLESYVSGDGQIKLIEIFRN
ncbi:hypothetical protein [Chryseobacterium sp. Hurlbut01]|uniref:hypothetical protein n=1 Tax=Chryseobacterium sp. Hurlbut01 TaxID=1681828 RepID=UPI00067B509C|nr:hypothetical protein [Chryseobacterium sp. Hurlbut01]KNB60986.1 hypothetical protein AC804_17745 [Chryseobacterium sp. Hurlbut01]